MGAYLFNLETLVNNHINTYYISDIEQRENLLDNYPIYCYPYCYPLLTNSISIEFQNFWNWIVNSYSAQTYNRATVEFFSLYTSTINILEQYNYLENLIRSIIFLQKPCAFETLFREIHTVTEETANWLLQKDPDLEEATQTRNELNLFETTSEDETSSNHSINTMAGTMDANANAILASLQAIQSSLGRRTIVSIPVFKGDLQDPISWLEDFERAATTNHFDNAYK